MKQFSTPEKAYIIDNQSRLSIKIIAKALNCSWKDVYNCYSSLLGTREYEELLEVSKDWRIKKMWEYYNEKAKEK